MMMNRSNEALLQVVLTDATAAIKNAIGNVTIYRRHNKPELGPVGDSLDDSPLRETTRRQ